MRRCAATLRSQEIAAKRQVHPNPVSPWKRQAVEGMAGVFARGGRLEGPTEAEVEELHAKIGRLAVENDFVARAQAMSPAEKKNLIRRDHPELGISPQCGLVRLSRSAFCYAPVGIDAATLARMKAIDRVFTKSPFYGPRQIVAYLRRDGIAVGRHPVRRLMAKTGLETICKRPAPASRIRSPRSARIC